MHPIQFKSVEIPPVGQNEVYFCITSLPKPVFSLNEMYFGTTFASRATTMQINNFMGAYQAGIPLSGIHRGKAVKTKIKVDTGFVTRASASLNNTR
jgi:hypothetical protein